VLRGDRFCGPSTPGPLPARGAERPVQHHPHRSSRPCTVPHAAMDSLGGGQVFGSPSLACRASSGPHPGTRRRPWRPPSPGTNRQPSPCVFAPQPLKRSSACALEPVPLPGRQRRRAPGGAPRLHRKPSRSGPRSARRASPPSKLALWQGALRGNVGSFSTDGRPPSAPPRPPASRQISTCAAERAAILSPPGRAETRGTTSPTDPPGRPGSRSTRGESGSPHFRTHLPRINVFAPPRDVR